MVKPPVFNREAMPAISRRRQPAEAAPTRHRAAKRRQRELPIDTALPPLRDSGHRSRDP